MMKITMMIDMKIATTITKTITTKILIMKIIKSNSYNDNDSDYNNDN